VIRLYKPSTDLMEGGRKKDEKREEEDRKEDKGRKSNERERADNNTVESRKNIEAGA